MSAKKLQTPTADSLAAEVKPLSTLTSMPATSFEQFARAPLTFFRRTVTSASFLVGAYSQTGTSFGTCIALSTKYYNEF
jgi:hypothetical protein